MSVNTKRSEIEIAGAAHLVRHQLSNKPKGAGTNPIEIDGTQLKMVLGALKKAEVVELIVLDDSLALLQDNTQFHLCLTSALMGQIEVIS